MSRLLRAFLKDESGQDLLEYSLVMLAIASGALASNVSLAADFVTWRVTLQTQINSYMTGA